MQSAKNYDVTLRNLFQDDMYNHDHFLLYVLIVHSCHYIIQTGAGKYNSTFIMHSVMKNYYNTDLAGV